MEWTKLMSILLDCCKTQSALYVLWENNLYLKVIVDTVFETDNGLDMDDEEYQEFYMGLLEIQKIINYPTNETFDRNVGECIEISIMNEPVRIELEDHTILWNKL